MSQIGYEDMISNEKKGEAKLISNTSFIRPFNSWDGWGLVN